MSSKIHVEHQLRFSSLETIRAKQSFEQMSLANGVLFSDYHADNGVLKANSYVKHLKDHNQMVRYCGVNSYHQNDVAERAIRTVSEMARAILLHASSRWKNGISRSLWPMAIDYSTYIYNNIPNDAGVLNTNCIK